MADNTSSSSLSNFWSVTLRGLSANSILASIFGNTKKSSTIGFQKYPSLREHPVRSTTKWLEGKRCDDGAEGLWRIYDGLYDFTAFLNAHPGGSTWLQLTEGTDITEAFETHHIGITPETLLPKFFKRTALIPRNSPFTFDKDGFYKTLKKEVAEVLKTAPTWPAQRSKVIADLLLLSYLMFTFLSIYFWNLIFGAIAGVLLASLAIAGHNFFHRKDNFRMYYFDLLLFSSRSWRISHALSHHLYTNTIYDFEISAVEPFLQYLPGNKGLFLYLSVLYSPLAYSLVVFVNLVTETIGSLSSGKGFPVMYLLPFTVPITIIMLTGKPFFWGMLMFMWILTTGSFYFGLVGLNAAHHHPEIFHDGDAPRPKEDLDWGIHQLDAVMDRKEITGSHYLVLTSFGDHALHHLFPTIDHGLLEYLYPVFKDTCEKFGVQFRMKSQLDLMLGQFKQLLTTTPNLTPPPTLKVLK